MESLFQDVETESFLICKIKNVKYAPNSRKLPKPTMQADIYVSKGQRFLENNTKIIQIAKAIMNGNGTILLEEMFSEIIVVIPLKTQFVEVESAVQLVGQVDTQDDLNSRYVDVHVQHISKDVHVEHPVGQAVQIPLIESGTFDGHVAQQVFKQQDAVDTHVEQLVAEELQAVQRLSHITQLLPPSGQYPLLHDNQQVVPCLYGSADKQVKQVLQEVEHVAQGDKHGTQQPPLRNKDKVVVQVVLSTQRS